MKLFGMMVGFLIVFPVFGTEVVWLGLFPEIKYEGEWGRCEYGPSTLFGYYLAAEVDAARRTTKAVVATSPRGGGSRLELTEAEAKELSFYEDSWGGFWLDRFAASPRLIQWLFERTLPSECYSRSAKVRGVSPETLLYSFDLKAVKEGIPVSHSFFVSFKGVVGEDNSPFSARMKFVQRKRE